MEEIAKHPDVARAYRAARDASDPHVSQERLAGEVGLTRRHIIRIENGEYRPKPENRDRIAEVLGVEPESLPAREAVAPPFQPKGSS